MLPRRLRHAPCGGLRRPEDRAAAPVGTRVDGTLPGSTADAAVRHLNGVRGALAGAARMGAGPVLRDRFHVRMLAQPGGQGSSPAALDIHRGPFHDEWNYTIRLHELDDDAVVYDDTNDLTYGNYLSTWFCVRS